MSSFPPISTSWIYLAVPWACQKELEIHESLFWLNLFDQGVKRLHLFLFIFPKKKIDQSPHVLISHLVNDEQYFNLSILFVESVLIVKDLGIQYTKSCVLGLQTSEFIEHHKIVDVLINEVIAMVCLVPDKCNTNWCSLARN